MSREGYVPPKTLASRPGGHYVSSRMGILQPIMNWLRRPRVKQFFTIALLAVIGLGLGLACGSWTRACAGAACPSIGVLEGYRPVQAAKLYAADGRLITDVGNERRTVLAFDDIAPEVRAAFIAVEDKRFYQHHGIDYTRILGAIKADLLTLRLSQGSSTITMQLARNVFRERLPPAKDFRRKVREMRVALELERTYSKNQILELYLNQIWLGAGSFGVETAAQRYFGKSARNLNVAEAALIAGINQRPARYDPVQFPARALQRRNVVIELMADQGYLTE